VRADAATILLADDDEDLLGGLKISLTREGYQVVTTGHGTKVVTLAARFKPELIILDVIMPGMGGIEVCREIRLRGGRTPVLMLTAKSEREDREAAAAAGASAYVTKPFKLSDLLGTIRQLIAGSSGLNF